jgi:hypothetical protein
MSLLASPRSFQREAAASGEVTRLNSVEQIKPFIYLNVEIGRIMIPLTAEMKVLNPQKEDPAFRRDLPVFA